MDSRLKTAGMTADIQTARLIQNSKFAVLLAAKKGRAVL
jgi:hypothetical protein